MSGKHAAAKGRPRAAALLPLAVFTTIAAAGVVGGNAQAATSTKFYTAAATPQYLDVAASATVTLTLFNCDATCSKKSTQSLGSARVTLPDGWQWAVNTSTITIWSGSTQSPKTSHWTSVSTWTADNAGGGTLMLLNDGTNAAYALAPGESLTVDATLVPDRDGVVNIPTETKQSNDFSGTGNDFLLSGSGAVIYVGTPYHLEFGTPPSDVQVSNSSGTHPMCPPPTVQVVDAAGNLVTSLDPLTVTLAPQPDTPQGRVSGLKYSGSTTLQQTTVAGTGTATFGSGTADSCTGLTASTLGGVYPLEASASWNGMTLTVPATDVPSFSVLQYVGPCGTTAATCTTPKFSDAGGHTSAQVTGNGSTTNRMSVGVGIGAYNLLSCNENPFRTVTQVDVANHSKTVTLIWDKKAVQWETNNGTPFWNVCFSAPYAFPTVGDYTAEPTPSSPNYEGLLVDCGTVDTATFPVGTYPCVMDRGKQAANEVVHVSIPLNSQADPKMV